jgi:hypothetical protein
MKITESRLRSIVKEETEALLEEHVTQISESMKGRLAALGLGLGGAATLGGAGAAMAGYAAQGDRVLAIRDVLEKYQGPAIERAYEKVTGEAYSGGFGGFDYKGHLAQATAEAMIQNGMKDPKEVESFMDTQIVSRGSAAKPSTPAKGAKKVPGSIKPGKK